MIVLARSEKNLFPPLLLAILLGLGPVTFAQENTQAPPSVAAAPSGSPAVSLPATPSPAAATPAPSGAALRNENVFASKLDTDGLQADNQRLGIDYVPVPQPVAEVSSYAAEYNQAPSRPSTLSLPEILPAWHAEMFESLSNSTFNARAFFQVGTVLPSHMNRYGARFSGGLPRWGFLSGGFTGKKDRGMVNGNLLVPLPSERTPLATDPRIRAIIQRYINGYPAQLPNRTDIDPRALNTNSPQATDSISGDLRLDGHVGSHGQLSLSHALNRLNIQAFQLSAGQNPDTSIHFQESRATYRHVPNEFTEYSVSANYTRQRSDLHVDAGAVGPTVVPNTVTYLGPAIQYPINRAENTFHYGFLGSHSLSGGKHRLTFGGDFYRYQMNGSDDNNQRGLLYFTDDFGRTSMQNFLLGIPSSYQVSIGSSVRGFRSWTTDAFFGDKWAVSPNFQLYLGVRYNATSAPVEVNHRDIVPFDTDGNNFSPLLSIAYRGPANWVLRAGYAISFGSIYPVTYSQIRYNAPNTVTVNVAQPNLLDLLAGVNLNSATQRVSVRKLSPDLVDPYSHQYSVTLEHGFGPVNLELAYVGSRTFKLLQVFQLNRALNVPGIPLTTATIDQRRPDPRYADVFDIANGGEAFLDAARASLRFRGFRGFTGAVGFTWSKALDEGSMYDTYAANNDIFHPSQFQYDYFHAQKARSDFDSPLDLSINGTYRTSHKNSLPRWMAPFVAGWEFSATVVARSGTPFNVTTGADGPGYGNVDGAMGDRPNILNTSILGATVGDPNTSTQILNRANFSFLSLGQNAGTLGRNAFRKQAIFNVNASVAREWRWATPRVYVLRLGVDAFNALNHAQFDAPQFNLAAPSFGRITNTLNNGRALEFGLRLSL